MEVEGAESSTAASSDSQPTTGICDVVEIELCYSYNFAASFLSRRMKRVYAGSRCVK